MKPTARIEDWWYDRKLKVLVGKVFDHPNQHQFTTGANQMTSKVKEFDPASSRAETQNTMYVLGKPYIPN